MGVASLSKYGLGRSTGTGASGPRANSSASITSDTTLRIAGTVVLNHSRPLPDVER